MLLDAGADPNGRTGEAGGHGGWTPLRCAVAGAANSLITRLLLERGAVPGDHDLYLARGLKARIRDRVLAASQLLAARFDLRNTAARLGDSGGRGDHLAPLRRPVSEVDRRAAAYLAKLTAGPAS